MAQGNWKLHVWIAECDVVSVLSIRGKSDGSLNAARSRLLFPGCRRTRLKLTAGGPRKSQRYAS